MLIYDGECGLCRNSAKWCRHRLPPDIDVVPSQRFSDDELAAMRLTRQDVSLAAWWIEEGCAPAGGADAVVRALLAMGGRQALIGRLLGLPLIKILTRRAYRWVAENRSTTSRWLARLPKRSRTAA